MKIKTIVSFVSVCSIACLFSISSVVFADSGIATSTKSVATSSSVKISAKELAKMTKTKEKATQEIVRRVQALTDLAQSISEMKNISDADRTNLVSQLQGQATALNNLQLQINNDDSTTTLKDDVKSITDSYRIFALVLPQGRIYATIDHLTTLVADLSVVGQKLQARINSAQAEGKNVTDVSKILVDYSTKLSDVQRLSQSAFTEVNGLVSDQGDQNVMKSNTEVLKDAHTKIQSAFKDISAIRKDIDLIRKSLPKQTSGTTTATTTKATSTPAR